MIPDKEMIQCQLYRLHEASSRLSAKRWEDLTITEKFKMLAEGEELVAEGDILLAEIDQALAERDKEIAELKAALAELKSTS